MPNAPNYDDVDVLNKRRLVAYISPDATSDPELDDVRPAYMVSSITLPAGPGLAEAVLVLDLASLGLRNENLHLSRGMSRRCEIWMLRDDPLEEDEDLSAIRKACLFRGELVQVDFVSAATADQFAEERVIVARLMPYHFGEPITGQQVWDYRVSDLKQIARDLEFNPEVDGVIVSNMVSSDDARNPEEFSIWVDPESTRSQTAIDEYHGTPAAWTLPEIIKTLAGLGNPTQTHVDSPSESLIDEVLSTAPAVENLTLPRGLRLHDYLSTILPRYGFNWFHSPDNSIGIYQVGKGTEKELRLAELGATVSLLDNNLTRLNLSYNIGEITTRLFLYGAFRQKEVTVELYRTWDSDEDNQIPTSDQSLPIGRRWAANEGGDYKGLREEIPENPPDLFGNSTIPRKRAIDDCLTYYPETRVRREPVLEYSTNNGSTWSEFNGNEETLQLSYAVLPGELGVWIANPELPTELQETDPEQLRLRITGTVTDDLRLQHATDDENETPNANTIVRVLDVSDQFHFRDRQADGEFSSVLEGDADETDDAEKLEAFAEALLPIEQAAQVLAEVVIPGITTEYQIGDILTGIDGRLISFNRFADGSNQYRYLQVVGIQYSNDGDQFTRLIVNPYDVG
jgi:hypothetical protein